MVPQDSPETMETNTDNYSHQDLASLYNSDGGSALFMPSMTSDIDMSCMRPALNQSGPSASSENSLVFIYRPGKVGRPRTRPVSDFSMPKSLICREANYKEF